MEFASFLAGERWSDHPSCAHPLLAQLARDVNDSLSDRERQQLVPLIPWVVGRRGDERTWLTLPVAVAAEVILQVPEETQGVLAAGLLCAEQLCVEAGADLAATQRAARTALNLVPGAVAWVARLDVAPRTTARLFTARSAPALVRCAVAGIVKSEAPDRDLRLRALLEMAIAVCPSPQPADRRPGGPAGVPVHSGRLIRPLSSP